MVGEVDSFVGYDSPRLVRVVISIVCLVLNQNHSDVPSAQKQCDNHEDFVNYLRQNPSQCEP